MITEIYTLSRQTRTIGLSEGKPDIVNSAHVKDACLRVLNDQRMALLSKPGLNRTNVGESIKIALEMAKVNYPDPHRQFAFPLENKLNAVPWDTSLFNRSVDEVTEVLSGIESVILGYDPRITKVLKLQFHENLYAKSIENSHGLNVNSTSSSISVTAEILAQEGTTVEAGWDSVHSRFIRDLSLNKWAESLAKETVESLGAKAIVSGKMTVVVHPKVGAQLLSLLSHALSAESVQMGRSFFRGKMKEQVASDVVTLCDDPFLPVGIATDIVDDEGTPHQFVDLVKNGYLENYFYDLRSAHYDAVSSNGHGIKAGLSSMPSPHPSNFFLSPGTHSLDQLLSFDRRVFLVRDVMGLHMADLITGEFSLGASGLLFENGKVIQSVRGVTMAGTLGDLLKKIAAVGNEIVWKGAYGSPYFVVHSIDISGS